MFFGRKNCFLGLFGSKKYPSHTQAMPKKLRFVKIVLGGHEDYRFLCFWAEKLIPIIIWTIKSTVCGYMKGPILLYELQ